MLKRKPHPNSPWSSLPPRTHRLAPASADQRAGRGRQQVATRQAADDSDGCCLGCRGTWFLTPSHCWSQKHYPQHRANPRNILILCVNCHDSFENNKLKFRRVCPVAWAETLRRMEEVDGPAFRRFQTLNPHLFS